MQGTLLRKLISGQTEFLQARHAVLTANLANADTPGFKPKDIAAPNFAKLVERSTRQTPVIGMAKTSAGHQQGSGSARSSSDARKVDGYEVALAGNAVIIEEQAQKLQQTRLDYELTTGIYTKLKGIMRTALGNNGG